MGGIGVLPVQNRIKLWNKWISCTLGIRSAASLYCFSPQIDKFTVGLIQLSISIREKEKTWAKCWTRTCRQVVIGFPFPFEIEDPDVWIFWSNGSPCILSVNGESPRFTANPRVTFQVLCIKLVLHSAQPQPLLIITNYQLAKRPNFLSFGHR